MHLMRLECTAEITKGYLLHASKNSPNAASTHLACSQFVWQISIPAHLSRLILPSKLNDQDTVREPLLALRLQR